MKQYVWNSIVEFVGKFAWKSKFSLILTASHWPHYYSVTGTMKSLTRREGIQRYTITHNHRLSVYVENSMLLLHSSCAVYDRCLPANEQMSGNANKMQTAHNTGSENTILIRMTLLHSA